MFWATLFHLSTNGKGKVWPFVDTASETLYRDAASGEDLSNLEQSLPSLS